jgi:hypothetical protein
VESDVKYIKHNFVPGCEFIDVVNLTEQWYRLPGIIEQFGPHTCKLLEIDAILHRIVHDSHVVLRGVSSARISARLLVGVDVSLRIHSDTSPDAWAACGGFDGWSSPYQRLTAADPARGQHPRTMDDWGRESCRPSWPNLRITEI